MPMLFRFSVTSALWLLLCSFAVGALAAPSVSVTNILRLQPGWVRVYLQALDPPLNPQFGAFPSCASPTSPNSITAMVNNGANLAIDLKIDPTWLADNGLPAPCHVTQLNVVMTGGGLSASATANVDIAMDLPLQGRSGQPAGGGTRAARCQSGRQSWRYDRTVAVMRGHWRAVVAAGPGRTGPAQFTAATDPRERDA